jgi:hypothetical protein
VVPRLRGRGWIGWVLTESSSSKSGTRARNEVDPWRIGPCLEVPPYERIQNTDLQGHNDLASLSIYAPIFIAFIRIAFAHSGAAGSRHTSIIL